MSPEEIKVRLDETLRATYTDGEIIFGTSREQEVDAREIFDADDRVRIESIKFEHGPCPVWETVKFKLRVLDGHPR